MDIILLSCLRKARVRLDESIAVQRKKNRLKERFMGPLRVILLPAEIPMFFAKGAHFYLPSSVRTNSKYAPVYNELVRAGIRKDSIAIQPVVTVISGRGLLRILVRMPLSLFFILKRLRPGSSLDWVDTYILLGRACYRSLFSRYPGLLPIIISDVSPALHMMWSAAVAEDNRAIWWQEDYHHYAYLPFSVLASVVLNENGLLLAQKYSCSQEIFVREKTNVCSLRPVAENPRVGVAVNAFFHATEKQRALLKDIKECLCAGELRIRLHPNSLLQASDFPESWIDIAPDTELLQDFVNHIDLCVVGNSAVQLRLLCEGVPVVHVEGLDDHGYDAYTYCSQGFVYGVQNVRDLTLEGVASFYSRKESVERLESYVGVSTVSDAQPLSNISRLFPLKQ